MADAYKTIQQEGGNEFILSRSRFISRAKPVGAEEEALAFIEKMRKAYRDASHTVWAYALRTGRERFDDDGEPRGTAGIPVLEVIRKEELQDLAVVVTRYFGGVKLGASGLIRAYTRGAKIAVEAGIIIRRRPYLSFKVSAGYHFAERLIREYDRKGFRLIHTTYTDLVTLTVLAPPEETDNLRMLTAECTAGQGVILAGTAEYLDFPL